MRFEAPIFLVLLLLLPVVVYPGGVKHLLNVVRGRIKFKGEPDGVPNTTTGYSQTIMFGASHSLGSLPKSWRTRISSPLFIVLESLLFVLLVVGLARPQAGTVFTDVQASGRDIILALDISGSMRGLDFELDGKTASRLQALKHVVKQFIDSRPNDRLGLIVFGSEVYTQCPLTLDHRSLKNFVDNLEIGMAGEGTAIGDALALSLKRAKEIEADSKVIVLVTDGANNSGKMRPLEAAELAKRLSIKVHTIGIGRGGLVPMPAKDFFGRDVVAQQQMEYDEATLEQIASETGGQYYNALSTKSLEKVYQDIDRLEPRTENYQQYIQWRERFHSAVVSALVLLFIGQVLQMSYFLKIP